MRELARGLLILAELPPFVVGRDDGDELVVALGQRTGLVSVRVHGGVREGTLKLSVLAGQVAEPIEHDQDLLSLKNGLSARVARASLGSPGAPTAERPHGWPEGGPFGLPYGRRA